MIKKNGGDVVVDSASSSLTTANIVIDDVLDGREAAKAGAVSSTGSSNDYDCELCNGPSAAV
jgi:hypothetical protein